MKNEGRQRVCVDTGTSPNLPTGAAFGLLYLSAVIVVSLRMSNLPIGVGLDQLSLGYHCCFFIGTAGVSAVVVVRSCKNENERKK